MSNDPHNRQKHLQKDEEDEEDPVEKMLEKVGCAQEHYAVQECMSETRDWRQCQTQVKEFRNCIAKSQKDLKTVQPREEK